MLENPRWRATSSLVSPTRRALFWSSAALTAIWWLESELERWGLGTIFMLWPFVGGLTICHRVSWGQMKWTANDSRWGQTSRSVETMVREWCDVDTTQRRVGRTMRWAGGPLYSNFRIPEKARWFKAGCRAAHTLDIFSTARPRWSECGVGGLRVGTAVSAVMFFVVVRVVRVSTCSIRGPKKKVSAPGCTTKYD